MRVGVEGSVRTWPLEKVKSADCGSRGSPLISPATRLPFFTPAISSAVCAAITTVCGLSVECTWRRRG